jgi:uncharacterized membrane protein YdjX (TVP38/TMEM64 family)
MNRWLGITAAAVVIGCIALLALLGPPAGGVDRLRELLLSWGPWAVAVSAALMVAQAIIAPLPANVITITNGLVFGPIWGSLLSWSSMLLGSSICFVLSRTLGRPFATRVVGKSLDKAESFFNRYGLQAVFLVRIMPFVPFDAVSFGAGLVGVPYLKFILATAVGTIPSIMVYSYIGSKVSEAYWWVLIGALCASLIALALATRLLKRPAPATLQI